MAASQLSPAHCSHEMLLFLISDLRLFSKYLSELNMFIPTLIGFSYTWTVIQNRGWVINALVYHSKFFDLDFFPIALGIYVFYQPLHVIAGFLFKAGH
jgi:hypothetical protein